MRDAVRRAVDAGGAALRLARFVCRSEAVAHVSTNTTTKKTTLHGEDERHSPDVDVSSGNLTLVTCHFGIFISIAVLAIDNLQVQRSGH